MIKKMVIATAIFSAVCASFYSSFAGAQGLYLDFKRPTFSTCKNRPSCTVEGVTVYGFRTANREPFILDAETRPATLHWDRIDGLGVQRGNQDDEIDPDEKIVIVLPRERSVRLFALSDLFLGSNGRDSAGGEYATIHTFTPSGTTTTYELQGGIELPDEEFNKWGSLPLGVRRLEEIDEAIITVVMPLADARAGLRASGLRDDQAVVKRFYPRRRDIGVPANGAQKQVLSTSIGQAVNRIEFMTRQKENNDYSIEGIEFY